MGASRVRVSGPGPIADPHAAFALTKSAIDNTVDIDLISRSLRGAEPYSGLSGSSRDARSKPMF
jgi:hypothetical protein